MKMNVIIRAVTSSSLSLLQAHDAQQLLKDAWSLAVQADAANRAV